MWIVSLALPLLFLVGELRADSPQYWSSYERRALEIQGDQYESIQGTAVREKYWRDLIATQPKDPEVLYIAYQQLNFVLLEQSNAVEGLANCLKFPPKKDDYEAQAVCLHFDTDQSSTASWKTFEKIFREAREHTRGTIVPARIVARSVLLFNDTRDIPQVISMLKQAMETVPNEAYDMQNSLKRNIAFLYITPSNSLDVIKQGIQLFDEAEQHYAKVFDWENVENVAYNKAIALIMSLKDYAGALKELNKVKIDDSLRVDVQVFKAFTLAKLGQTASSLNILPLVDFQGYSDKARIPFLKCYMELTRSLNKVQANMDPCLHLPQTTQSDVIIHLTNELHQKTDWSSSDELQLWRQFYWFYQNKLTPSMQAILENSIDGLELQRARFESQLKDAEILVREKDSQLKEYMLFFLAILLAVFAFSWRRIFIQHRKIHRLNNFIQTRVLQRFLPPEIVKEILSGHNRLDESAHLMSVTVLFADLCEFTRQAEDLGPQRIAAILNTFLVRMTEVIFEHGGTIDKFIGDGIMVIFGAPTELPLLDQAQKAVHCAKAMHLALDALSVDWKSAGYPGFKMRVGIHQGPGVVGSFGGPKRSDYTVIGGTVNISSRIQRKASPGETWVSRTLIQHLPELTCESTGNHSLNGVDQPLELFTMRS